MPWHTSDRKARLPRNWKRIRATALERAGFRCEWVRVDTGTRCTELATDVDHVVPGDDHSPANLQALCAYHHARKSAREGAKAANANRPRRAREPEPHPGIRRRGGQGVGGDPQ